MVLVFSMLTIIGGILMGSMEHHVTIYSSTVRTMDPSWDYTSYGVGSKPHPPGEHQNSWDLWMFIPLKMDYYRYWSIPILQIQYLFLGLPLATGRSAPRRCGPWVHIVVTVYSSTCKISGGKLGCIIFREPFYVKIISMLKWLVVSNMNVIFHVIYGMSSFPLTNSIIFQDGCCTTTKQMIVLVSSVITTTFHNISRHMLTTFLC